MKLEESTEKPQNCLNCGGCLFAEDGEPFEQVLILKKEMRNVIGSVYCGAWCNMECFSDWIKKQ